MSRKDFLAFKKKSSYLGRAKSKKNRRLKNKKLNNMDTEATSDVLSPQENNIGKPQERDVGEEFYGLFDSVVFKDELRDYVSSVINNSEPNEFVYYDIGVSESSTLLGGTGPTLTTLTDGINVYRFDKTQDESVHFVLYLPSSYMEGTDIVPHVHWCPIDTDTGSVTWALEYTIANVGATIGSSTTITATDPADGTALKHQEISFDAIDGTGLEIDSVIACRFYRDVDNGDDYDNDAALLEVAFKVQLDSRGASSTDDK